MNFKTFQSILFLLMVFSVTGVFFWLIQDYIMPIFWALTLYIVFKPWYSKINDKLGDKRALSSFVTIVTIIVTTIIPISLFSAIFFNEASNLYETYLDYTIFSVYEDARLIKLQDFVDSARINISVQGVMESIFANMQNYSASISSLALGVGKTSLNFLVKLAIMFYVLFFMFKDGKRWYATLLRVLPLGDKKEKYLFSQFATMVRAVFKGSFVIAGIQGVLGFLLFALAGVPSPVVWGVAMAILALIPAIGPALVWLPVGVVMILLGHVTTGIIILVFGGFVISMVDNLLRPVLMGKETALPDLLIFLSVLGGLSTFGMAGIVIGPIIATLFVAIWKLFELDYKTELDRWG